MKPRPVYYVMALMLALAVIAGAIRFVVLSLGQFLK